MRDGTARQAWASIATDPLLHRAFAVALAEMVARGLSPEDLAGVNGFIFTVLNLSEENPSPRSIPSKHLQSFGQPVEEPPKK